MLRDYGFLEDVDDTLHRADRQFGDLAQQLQLQHAKKHKQRVALLHACARPERRTKLLFAPVALEVARKNSSRVLDSSGKPATVGKGAHSGKGKGRGKGRKGGQSKNPKVGSWKEENPFERIVWKVEWHFAKSNQVLIDHSLSENDRLGDSLARFFQNKAPCGATEHLLQPYVKAGIDQLEVFLHQPSRAVRASLADNTPGKHWMDVGMDLGLEFEGDESDSVTDDDDDGVLQAQFVALDLGTSIRQSLEGMVLVEHPVFYVALPEERCHYRQHKGDLDVS